jgi:hypothetical protein
MIDGLVSVDYPKLRPLRRRPAFRAWLRGHYRRLLGTPIRSSGGSPSRRLAEVVARIDPAEIDISTAPTSLV